MSRKSSWFTPFLFFMVLAGVANELRAEFRLATFRCDVTIPIGHRCMGVLPTKSKTITDRLYANGFVLLSQDKPVVVCAVDWCEIRNGSYDQWRDALAKSANTTRERVLVCSLHQHDAPVTDKNAADLLRAANLTGELYDEPFHDDAVKRVANSLATSLKHAQTVTHLGMGQAKVKRIASNRRVVMPSGQVMYSRGSRSGSETFHRQAADGEIDPFLKTISFWTNEQPRLALHAYATHPMSYYGAGEVSADFVGLARERRQRDDLSIKQIYVSGCSGDVTAGKYNDGSADSRLALTERLYNAMVTAWKNTRRVPLTQVRFRNTQFELDFHPDPSLSEKALANVLADDSKTVETRILAAMGLASRQRVGRRQKIDMPCLDLGEAKLLLFPGESFVGYQLLAQEMCPESFVLSIGYGECWPGYIPTESAFRDAFHDKWLWVAPRFRSPNSPSDGLCVIAQLATCLADIGNKITATNNHGFLRRISASKVQRFTSSRSPSFTPAEDVPFLEKVTLRRISGLRKRARNWFDTGIPPIQITLLKIDVGNC